MDPEVQAEQNTEEEHSNDDQQQEAGQEQEQSGNDGGQAAEQEFESITFEGASPTPEDEHQNAPAWVKEVRAQNRELVRRKRELEEENAQLKAPAKATELGAKPTLAESDYDEEKFEAALTEWNARKAQHEAEGKRKQEAQQAAQAEWEGDVQRYQGQKAALKVADYADAEAVVEQTFSQAQQAILVQGAEDAARLAYALGKNPAEAKKLASITNPLKFAFAAAKLETKLKTEPRKSAPLPEAVVKGNAAVVGADKKIQALEAEADRTGDRSKLIAYRREQNRAKT